MMRLAWVALLVACHTPLPTHNEVVHDPATKKAACIDENNCSPHLGHCLDVCHKYNHPNGPKNDECDRNCRRNYCGHVEC